MIQMDNVDKNTRRNFFFFLQNKVKIISHNLTFQITNSLQLRKYNNYLQCAFTWRHVNKTFVKIINQKPKENSCFPVCIYKWVFEFQLDTNDNRLCSHKSDFTAVSVCRCIFHFILQGEQRNTHPKMVSFIIKAHWNWNDHWNGKRWEKLTI